MTGFNGRGCASWSRMGFGFCLALVWLWLPARTYAICGLDAAVFEQIRNLQDPDAARAWRRQIARPGGMSCVVCHVAGFGPRNPYGSAINVLLTGNDREDPARKREAGRRVNDIPANPALPGSPTFGDLIRKGLLPASDLTPDLLRFQNLSAESSEEITLEGARALVQQIQAESRFGILQLSGTYEMSSEAAAVIAQFRGEMLILGLKSLSPEVAQALANRDDRRNRDRVCKQPWCRASGARGRFALRSPLQDSGAVPIEHRTARRGITQQRASANSGYGIGLRPGRSIRDEKEDQSAEVDDAGLTTARRNAASMFV